MRDIASARDARGEAQAALGDDLEARVLEPSGPAVTAGDWLADDPVDPGGASRPIVSPVPGLGQITWDDWLRERPECAAWAAERWLGAYRRLAAPPPSLAETRRALHRLAVYVVSPARRRANGKIALRWTLGGFGTPFFGDDEQVRLADGLLVRQRAGAAAAEPVTTLARAAAFVLEGPPDPNRAAGHDLPLQGEPDRELMIDAAAAAYLGDWYGVAVSTLEELRADADAARPSRVQIWPEHFDMAFDCAPGGREVRATFGASPGDAVVGEPYLYVLPWAGELPGSPELWNATSFPGAILPLGQLLGAADQRGAALAFMRDRLALLRG
jgi:hypothetical protein